MTKTKKKDTPHISTTKTKRKASIANSRIEKYYNKIVIGFVVLTCILVCAIVYFSFSNTTITVTPAQIQSDLSFVTSVSELSATVVFTDVEGSKTITNIQSSESKPAKATGTVTIINNYSQNQPLVETTRLLSKEGVLFRTQETVTVPAGGSVEVPVMADEEGAKGNIDASTFEIVALWDGLKDDIYAESDSAMTGGLVNVGVVSQTDIANAQEELENDLTTQALETLNQEIQDTEGLPAEPYIPTNAYRITSVTEESSVQGGEEVDNFEVHATMTVAAVVVNKPDFIT